MEHEPYRILWVSSAQSVPTTVQRIAQGQTARLIQLTQAEPYEPAIQAVQQCAPDLVLVMNDFEPLAILEFVHHSRLLDSQVPVIILCSAYDAALDYKSRKLGATDCIPVVELDGEFFQRLLKAQPVKARRPARNQAPARPHPPTPWAIK